MKRIVTGLMLVAFSGVAMAWTHHENKNGHYWDVDDAVNSKSFLALTCNDDQSSNVIFYADGTLYQVPKISAYKSIRLLVGHSTNNDYTLIDEKKDPVKGNPHRYTGKGFAKIFNMSDSFKIITSDGKEYKFTPSDKNEIDFSVCY